jgi:hypothetical protein
MVVQIAPKFDYKKMSPSHYEPLLSNHLRSPRDAYASAIEVGVSSTRFTMTSSPKDFAILCLLFLIGTSLSSFSSVCSSDSTGDSIGIVLSRPISVEI